MLTPFAQVLTTISVPTAATVYWTIRRRTTWICVIADAAAIAISTLMRLPFSTYAVYSFFPPYGLPLLSRIAFSYIAIPLFYGLIKNGAW